MPSDSLARSLYGCLLGGALGDALGLPREGLSRRRGRRMFPDPGRFAFFFGKGMGSDDAEHLAMTAQALAAAPGDADAFARALAWRLRFWLLGLPAGVGLATLRGIVKLWLGFPASKSGVFSAGNGPAMRSPVIGVGWGHDPIRMRALVQASTLLTHRDPKAFHGALAVALAAYYSSTGRTDADAFHAELAGLLGESEPARELLDLVGQAARSGKAGEAPEAFADRLGLEKGVTGYMYHTVPVALQAWFRNPGNLHAALTDVIALGGDTDTAAAIVGGIVGAGLAPDDIPARLREGWRDWPLTLTWLERLADSAARAIHSQTAQKPPRLFFPAKLFRNLFFMAVVLAHGFRRLLPPY